MGNNSFLSLEIRRLNTCLYYTRMIIKESDPGTIKFRMMIRAFIQILVKHVILRLSASTLHNDSAHMPHETSTPQVCDAICIR